MSLHQTRYRVSRLLAISLALITPVAQAHSPGGHAGSAHAARSAVARAPAAGHLAAGGIAGVGGIGRVVGHPLRPGYGFYRYGWGAPFYGVGFYYAGFYDPWFWQPLDPLYVVPAGEPPVTLLAPPVAGTAPAGSDVLYRYYCRTSNAYYPTVPTCTVPWLKVVPQ